MLGVVQGLTEFLPVSSSAHLILARAFFGWETPPEFGLAFDVSLHVGTLAAILTFFRREIAGMVRALPSALQTPPTRRLVWCDDCRRHDSGGHRRPAVQRLHRGQCCGRRGVAAWALTVGAVAMMAAERAGTPSREPKIV